MVEGLNFMPVSVPQSLGPLFGLHFTLLSETEIVRLVAEHVPSPEEGVHVVVTPNIQHVALMRENGEFRKACEQAEILTCDGFPLYYYARCRGLRLPGRVTGREITQDLFAMPEALKKHRIFAVVDSERTGLVARQWACTHGMEDRFAFYVPPVGFENDPGLSGSLARLIRDHATTLLFMGVGAPRSELFVSRHRADLPPCWALCVGQSLLVALGLLPTPPFLVQRLNLEWLWRICLEPRRLTGRYVRALFGFGVAVCEDLLRLG
ncbi:MAG: WecB/TagA/CpsF family glycosyltransferase [Gluconacetobacter sp.]